jgi:hypothetical protein
MVDEATDQEITYYQDDNVYVTNKRVKLGDNVYALDDVKWVGVQQRAEGMRLLGWELPPGLAYDIAHNRIPLLFRAAVFWVPAAIAGLVRLLFPPDNELFDVLAFGVFALGVALAMRHLNRMRRMSSETNLLGISIESGTHYPLGPLPEGYLKRVEEVIKQAMRDRQRVEHGA